MPSTINDHCGGAATLSRLDLVQLSFQLLNLTRTFLSCYFKIFKHGTMDLEHLYPVNNTIRLRLSANLPAVKGLIQQLQIEIQTLKTLK